MPKLLEKHIETLSELENLKNELDIKIISKRKQIFDEMKKEKLDKFDNDKVKIFPVVRKTIVFNKSKEEIIATMKELKLNDYYKEIKETRLSKDFETAFKNCEIAFDGLSLEQKVIPTIKFNKNE